MFTCVIIKLTKFNCQCNSKLELSLAKIPKIVATFVYASSQGQRTHSTLTPFEPRVVTEILLGPNFFVSTPKQNQSRQLVQAECMCCP
jgi:hypothetical protein